MVLHRGEGRALRDVVAEDYEGRAEQRVVCGGRGVVEREGVGPCVEGDVEGEGLVQVAQRRERIWREGLIAVRADAKGEAAGCLSVCVIATASVQ